VRASIRESKWLSLLVYRQVVQAQLDRDQKLDDLVTTMERLYSFVDVAGDWKNKIGLLERIIIKIAEKTRECAI
jgi:hypothetical protein